jgi:hypothetical protein
VRECVEDITEHVERRNNETWSKHQEVGSHPLYWILAYTAEELLHVLKSFIGAFFVNGMKPDKDAAFGEEEACKSILTRKIPTPEGFKAPTFVERIFQALGIVYTQYAFGRHGLVMSPGHENTRKALSGVS